jgi:8-oxo-dGTP pyrophosphatase MutT (NUDIX family)
MNTASVRALVGGYTPGEDPESQSLARLRRLVADFEDPWNRHRFDPGHLTASAFVLSPSRTSIALVHHEKLDLWVQPGGHVEADDPTHQAAARREVAEECLVSDPHSLGLIDLDIHVFPARAGQPEHLHFDLRWAFVARTHEIGSGDGTLAVRWVPLLEAAEMDESIARAARKLLDYADRS